MVHCVKCVGEYQPTERLACARNSITNIHSMESWIFSAFNSCRFRRGYARYVGWEWGHIGSGKIDCKAQPWTCSKTPTTTRHRVSIGTSLSSKDTFAICTGRGFKPTPVHSRFQQPSRVHIWGSSNRKME